MLAMHLRHISGYTAPWNRSNDRAGWPILKCSDPQQRLALWLVFVINGLQEYIDYQGFLHIIEQGIDNRCGEQILWCWRHSDSQNTG